jgi:flagellar motor switch protein FliN/FliY
MSEEEINTSETEDSSTDDWSAAMEEQAEPETSTAEADWGDALEEQAATDTKDDLQTAEFQEFAANNEAAKRGSNEDVNLDVILDVPVTISMEIGRTQVNIRNLLQLNQGSVVELDRLAGEPMDVLVNGTLVAHGEVVVVNEKFGIRLTDVISPSERVRRLA